MGSRNSVKSARLWPIRYLAWKFLPQILNEFLCDYSEFLIFSGEDTFILGDLDKEIEYKNLADILNMAAIFSDCEHLGILLGRLGGVSSLGVMALEILGSSNIRSSLKKIETEFCNQDRGAIVRVSFGDAASLSYIIVDTAVNSSAVISDAAMANAMQILTDLCGPAWTPELVELSRREPADCRPYRHLFKSPIVFNSAVATIHFSGRWLDQPVARYCTVTSSATEYPSPEFAEPELTERVLLHLARSLSTGKMTSANRVAHVFGMCNRTLQRELTKAETSYRLLSEHVRFGVAKRLLQDTDMPVTDIALTVGYADASVLTRAFTRWAGKCPSEWRAANHQP